MVILGEGPAFHRDFVMISHCLPHWLFLGLFLRNLLSGLISNQYSHLILHQNKIFLVFFMSTKAENPHSTPTTLMLSTWNHQTLPIMDLHLITSLPTTLSTILQYFTSSPSTIMNMKLINDLNKLVNDILLAQDFNQEHLKGFEAGKEYKCLDDYKKDPGSGLAAQDGWIEASVLISLPCDGFAF